MPVLPMIGGGQGNTILSNAYNATISGGNNNLASGAVATVPGGIDNVAGGYASFAAGNGAQANHDGHVRMGGSFKLDTICFHRREPIPYPRQWRRRDWKK